MILYAIRGGRVTHVIDLLDTKLDGLNWRNSYVTV